MEFMSCGCIVSSCMLPVLGLSALCCIELAMLPLLAVTGFPHNQICIVWRLSGEHTCMQHWLELGGTLNICLFASTLGGPIVIW